MQQQTTTGEEGTPDGPPTYDELFPGLPASAGPNSHSLRTTVGGSNIMRVGCSDVTYVFRVPMEERKFDHNDKFGEGESVRTCQLITKETGAHIEIASSKDQSLTFLLTGKNSQVLDARRRILTTFQTQSSKQINIPKDHHRWILGKLGQRLKELENITSTRIAIPGMNEQSDVITITGTREGIEKAEHDIRVISDEQSRKAFERVNVPKIYHPFICGAHNENLNRIMAETGTTINIPPPSVQKDEITIGGETESVQSAVQKIEAIYRDMEKRCTIVSVEVPKQQHKYIIGPRGSTLAEILQLTGVSVEMPPLDSPTGTITLRGPQEKLGLALSKVYEKANSVRTSTVDAPAWIHKYIIGPKGANIRKVTQDLGKVNIEFNDKEGKIKIGGPPEEVEKAQKELTAMAQDFVDKLTSVELNVDPKFYKFIIGKQGANVNRLKTETGVVIIISEDNGNNIIRIEGSHAGVQKAQAELEDLVNKLENKKEKDIIIDRRYYGSIIGNKGDNIKEIREMFNQVQITIPCLEAQTDIVKIKGPKQDVDKCYKHLTKLVKEMQETNYVLEVPIFKKFHKFVIGKAGANIRKIREETLTKIDLPSEGETSDVIKITGKRENVEEAKEKILKIQSEMTSTITDEISIPPKFYNSLIGIGGKLIHSIMEDCGGVAIKFPPADSNSDKVSIRGPKEDVEKAKQQLLEITNEKQLSSYTVELRAKVKHHKFLIGKNGANVKKIRESTGARIIFPTEKDEDKELITIIGKKEAIEEAKALLESTINEIGTYVTIECVIPKRHHRTLMGRKGCKVKNITAEFDVQIKIPDRDLYDEQQTDAEQVNGENEEQDPDTVLPCDIIRITGLPENVEAAKQAMLDLVPVTIEVEVPFDLHGFIIGQKGRDVRQLMKTHDVHIVLSSQNEKLDYIKISGTPTCVESAKEAILERCKEVEANRQERALKSFELKLNIDPEYHPKIIGRRGAVITKIRTDNDVQIRFKKKGDPDENIISITGYEEDVHNARDDIMKIVNELTVLTKEEVHISASVHSRLIGARGNKIRKIMYDYNVDIQIPRKTDPEAEQVTIIGSEDNVLDAKEYLLKLQDEYLQDLEQREYQNSFRAPQREEDNANGGNSESGFVVKGGPWEQQNQSAPNTASVKDFPQFFGHTAATETTPDGVWGAKRQ